MRMPYLEAQPLSWRIVLVAALLNFGATTWTEPAVAEVEKVVVHATDTGYYAYIEVYGTTGADGLDITPLGSGALRFASFDTETGQSAGDSSGVPLEASGKCTQVDSTTVDCVDFPYVELRFDDRNSAAGDWIRFCSSTGNHYVTYWPSPLDDIISVCAVETTVHASAGGDSVNHHYDDGGFGLTEIYGGRGDDRLFGHGKIFGGAGTDVIAGTHLAELLRGGPGSDEVLGRDGNDTLFGDAGRDHMNPGRGDDVVYGNQGADDIRVVDGYGDDVNCGIGTDTVSGDWRDLFYRCETQSP